MKGGFRGLTGRLLEMYLLLKYMVIGFNEIYIARL